MNSQQGPAGRLAEFVRAEQTSSALLAIAAVVALVWTNSPIGDSYSSLWGLELEIFGKPFDLRHIVNDVLMTFFFLVVGLEIKRELVEGSLSDRQTAALPVIAALGGMIVPAALYLAFTVPAAVGTRGWGIPMATDIAFAVGALGIFGKRVPISARVFLLTLAIADDIGAIVVIAVFYSSGLQAQWLLMAAVGLIAMRFALRVSRWTIIPAACVVWLGVYLSGVHPTIAGVAIALTLPLRASNRPLVGAIQHRLHPWTAGLILPLFALVNAGVSFSPSDVRTALSSPIFAGVVVGLVVGKTLGITLFALGAIALKIGRLPDGLNRLHIVALAAIAGIGFTVALFVAELAFDANPAQLATAKMGVLIASLTAAVVALAAMRIALRRTNLALEVD